MIEETISETELNAFIDGELGPERTRQIEAEIARSPELAERVALYRGDKDLIGRVYGPLIERPLPAELLRPFARMPAEPSHRWGARVITALAAMLVVAILGWAAYPYILGVGGDLLVAQAISARNGELHAEQRIAAATVAPPAARDALVKNTLAVPAKVPDLGKAGFVLTDMEIYPDESGGHSIQLSYRDAGGTGKLFTLYMHRPNGPDRFDLEQRGQMQICIWQSDELSVVMLGEMSPKEMLKVATMTYADLNF